MDVTNAMDTESLAARLAEAAESLGLEVREGPADSDGAVVRLRGKKVVFVPEGALSTKLVEVLARALAQEDTEDVFLLPAVREAIERVRSAPEE